MLGNFGFYKYFIFYLPFMFLEIGYISAHLNNMNKSDQELTIIFSILPNVSCFHSDWLWYIGKSQDKRAYRKPICKAIRVYYIASIVDCKREYILYSRSPKSKKILCLSQYSSSQVTLYNCIEEIVVLTQQIQL